MKLRGTLLLALVLHSNQLLAQAARGYDGEDGRNGQNKIISANAPYAIDLSGGDGGSGGRGAEGSSGRCNSYTNSEGNTVNDDVRGEDGGRGGNGGDGGNGGNLTVLFTNVIDLKSIQFISRGGEGGYRGEGGSGGYGCPSGAYGDHGYSGDDGKAGNLYLVGQEFFPYQQDTSNQFNAISALMKGRKIVKNIWQPTEAKALLAPGSHFDKSFLLSAYEYGSAQVTLKDPSKIDPRLLEMNLQVVMNKGVTKILSDYPVMMAARHSSDAADAVLEIARLYKMNEFTSIGFETVYKKNNSRFIHLTTDVDLVPRPTLSMNLKVELKGRFFKYHEIYNGEVPASMIEALKAGYAVDLDQLPLAQKIPSEGKIRLSMKYKLQELDLKHEDEEVWVVKLKHVGEAEISKAN